MYILHEDFGHTLPAPEGGFAPGAFPGIGGGGGGPPAPLPMGGMGGGGGGPGMVSREVARPCNQYVFSFLTILGVRYALKPATGLVGVVYCCRGR